MSLLTGLYFSEDDESSPEHLRGLGVRIEDDVVIQEQGGALILSAHTPKSVCDVERACAQSERWWMAPNSGGFYPPLCVLVFFSWSALVSGSCESEEVAFRSQSRTGDMP